MSRNWLLTALFIGAIGCGKTGPTSDRFSAAGTAGDKVDKAAAKPELEARRATATTPEEQKKQMAKSGYPGAK